MSNNNHPHGHLSQAAQNPSWNPLQVSRVYLRFAWIHVQVAQTEVETER